MGIKFFANTFNSFNIQSFEQVIPFFLDLEQTLGPFGIFNLGRNVFERQFKIINHRHKLGNHFRGRVFRHLAHALGVFLFQVMVIGLSALPTR